MQENKLTSIVKLYQQKEKNLFLKFNAARKKLQGIIEQKQSLVNFQEEYQRAQINLGKQGIAIEAFLKYDTFLKSLDLAIIQQQDIITQGTKELAQKKAQWQIWRVKLDAITLILEKRIKEHKQQIEKKQQKIVEDQVNSTYILNAKPDS